VHIDSLSRVSSTFDPTCLFNWSQVHSCRSLVILGMRGAGKTTLARAFSLSSGFHFIDVDHAIEAKIGNIPLFIEKHSWHSFRLVEIEVFSNLLECNPTGCVIACGGGIVEYHENRTLLSKHGFVLQVKRCITDIVEDLSTEISTVTSRPLASDSELRAIWLRRQQLYNDCSHFDFLIPEGQRKWEEISARFCREIQLLVNPKRTKIIYHSLSQPGTFFVSLTFSRPSSDQVTALKSACVGVDAIELRIDLLENQDNNFVEEYVSWIRTYTCLPIIFTVRSIKHGGRFPSDDVKGFIRLLVLALRLYCDVIDIESHHDIALLQAIPGLLHGPVIIGSSHTTKEDVSDFQLLNDQCDLGGISHIKKIVNRSSSLFTTLSTCIQSSQSKFAVGSTSQFSSTEVLKGYCDGEEFRGKPVILLSIGNPGKLSRVLNTVLTPVTHPDLPAAAAVGQMTTKEIQMCRNQLSVLEAKSFYLFGSTISHSLSPQIHNLLFSYLDLPHKYNLFPCELSDVGSIIDVSRSQSFGGASVTTPFKEVVIKSGVVTHLTAAAQTIGAVNTIIPMQPPLVGAFAVNSFFKEKKDSGILLGDNTDWVGFLLPLSRLLSVRASQLASTTETTGRMQNFEVAIVIGVS
jgi:pentafunctional AROM polypeptide